MRVPCAVTPMLPFLILTQTNTLITVRIVETGTRLARASNFNNYQHRDKLWDDEVSHVWTVPISATIKSGTGRGTALPELHEATALWREFGLPFCSSKAAPVLVRIGARLEGRDLTVVGFQDPRSKPRILFVGSETYRINDLAFKPKAADWSLETAKSGSGTEWKDIPTPTSVEVPFGEDANLCAAIESSGIAPQEFQQQLLAQITSKPQRVPLALQWLGQPRDSSLRSLTAFQIETHLANLLASEKSDRKTILTALRRLQNKQLIAEGQTHRSLNTLVSELKDTLEPRKIKGRSLEIAVEGLLECSKVKSLVLGGGQRDTRYLAVKRMGLKICPFLISRLGDRRLTRSFTEDGPKILSLGNVCGLLLDDLSGGRLGVEATKAQAARWFQTVDVKTSDAQGK